MASMHLVKRGLTYIGTDMDTGPFIGPAGMPGTPVGVPLLVPAVARVVRGVPEAEGAGVGDALEETEPGWAAAPDGPGSEVAEGTGVAAVLAGVPLDAIGVLA